MTATALPPTAAASLSHAEFRTVAAILHADSRISLSAAKLTLVQSRLARRLRNCGLHDFRAYLKLVDADPVERAQMVSALTTNHTHFFRESHHFDHLRSTVLPPLRERAAAGEPVRLWSAGCSSGEEVYSMAMVLAGTRRDDADWLRGDVRLLATDLSQAMVDATRRGVYPAIGADQIPLPYRAAWLHPEGGGDIVVDAELRAAVTARTLNLFARWPFRGQFDIIFCRNVMIYFDADARADLEERLVAQHRPGGTLYVGHSERLSGAAAAAARSHGHTTYVKEG